MLGGGGNTNDPNVRRALALGTAAVQEAVAQAHIEKEKEVKAAVAAERQRWEQLLAAERAGQQKAQQDLGVRSPRGLRPRPPRAGGDPRAVHAGRKGGARESDRAGETRVCKGGRGRHLAG